MPPLCERAWAYLLPFLKSLSPVSVVLGREPWFLLLAWYLAQTRLPPGDCSHLTLRTKGPLRGGQKKQDHPLLLPSP